MHSIRHGVKSLAQHGLNTSLGSHQAHRIQKMPLTSHLAGKHLVHILAASSQTGHRARVATYAFSHLRSLFAEHKERLSQLGGAVDYSTALNQTHRTFENFWKETITIRNNDNRRHIPLLSVLKKSIQSIEDFAESNHQVNEYVSHVQGFLGALGRPSLSNDQGVATQNLYTALANLKSHIFLGCGFENQQMSSLATVLETLEPAVCKNIEQTNSMDELEAVLSKWVKTIETKLKPEQSVCEILPKISKLLNGEIFQMQLNVNR